MDCWLHWCKTEGVYCYSCSDFKPPLKSGVDIDTFNSLQICQCIAWSQSVHWKQAWLMDSSYSNNSMGMKYYFDDDSWIRNYICNHCIMWKTYLSHWMATVLQWNLYKATTQFCCLSRQVVFHHRQDIHDFVKAVPGKMMTYMCLKSSVSLYRFHCICLLSSVFQPWHELMKIIVTDRLPKDFITMSCKWLAFAP